MPKGGGLDEELDHETVAEQVVPYLNTYNTPKSLRLYLQDLIGTSAAAKTLAEKYVARRFPAEPNGKSSHLTHTMDSIPRHRDPPTSDSPRKAAAKPVRITPNNVAAALAASEHAAPRALPPTKEMKALDTAFSMLSVEPNSSEAAASFPESRRLCLCQGRKHALAEHTSLCSACGLILCAALRPVPVSPHSACPSCNASPIVPPHIRTQLLSELADKRERLVREQHEREAERLAELARNRHAETPFPTLGAEPSPAPAPATSRNRVLHLDMKTHKVTVTRAKEKTSQAKSKGAAPTPSSEMPTTAEDGSELVHDYADDGFRQRYIPNQPRSERHTTQSWAALLPELPHYVPEEKRPAPLEPVCSEVITEIPDLATLLQRKPPGSSADTQRRNKNSAIASGVARAQGRKTGKPSKKR